LLTTAMMTTHTLGGALVLAALLLSSPVLGETSASPEPPATNSAAMDAPPAQDANNQDDEFLDEFDDAAAAGPLIADPLEGFNRGMFWLNDKLYLYAMKPVARAVRIVPEPARVCVANFFNNLAAPLRIFNALLQAKFNAAGTEFSRFVINSTAGIGGLFDPAKKYANLRQIDEDFGQTLAAWGVGHGFYLFIPIIGPSSLRDGAGTLMGFEVDPADRVWPKGEGYWVAKGVDAINVLSLDKDTYEAIKRDSLDPYLFLRDAYVQYRARSVSQ
jgi:phospholipid-binding lipoprotein MlaA